MRKLKFIVSVVVLVALSGCAGQASFSSLMQKNQGNNLKISPYKATTQTH